MAVECLGPFPMEGPQLPFPIGQRNKVRLRPRLKAFVFSKVILGTEDAEILLIFFFVR